MRIRPEIDQDQHDIDQKLLKNATFRIHTELLQKS